jgi:hypothetical protein
MDFYRASNSPGCGAAVEVAVCIEAAKVHDACVANEVYVIGQKFENRCLTIFMRMRVSVCKGLFPTRVETSRSGTPRNYMVPLFIKDK